LLAQPLRARDALAVRDLQVLHPLALRRELALELRLAHRQRTLRERTRAQLRVCLLARGLRRAHALERDLHRRARDPLRLRRDLAHRRLTLVLAFETQRAPHARLDHAPHLAPRARPAAPLARLR